MADGSSSVTPETAGAATPPAGHSADSPYRDFLAPGPGVDKAAYFGVTPPPPDEERYTPRTVNSIGPMLRRFDVGGETKAAYLNDPLPRIDIDTLKDYEKRFGTISRRAVLAATARDFMERAGRRLRRTTPNTTSEAAPTSPAYEQTKKDLAAQGLVETPAMLEAAARGDAAAYFEAIREGILVEGPDPRMADAIVKIMEHPVSPTQEALRATIAEQAAQLLSYDQLAADAGPVNNDTTPPTYNETSSTTASVIENPTTAAPATPPPTSGTGNS